VTRPSALQPNAVDLPANPEGLRQAGVLVSYLLIERGAVGQLVVERYDLLVAAALQGCVAEGLVGLAGGLVVVGLLLIEVVIAVVSRRARAAGGGVIVDGIVAVVWRRIVVY
jgi:hypothetical protein